MLKKSKSLKKVMDRQGTVAVKVLVTINVDSVRFPVPPSLYQVLGVDHMEKLENADISVCFERGGKLASSSDGKLQRVSDDASRGKDFLELRVREPLALVVTAYRKTGVMQYQEKKGKVVIRQKKRSKLGGTSYGGLGMVELDIAEFLNASSRPALALAAGYPLAKCTIPNSEVYFSCEVKLLGEMDVSDDAMTNISGLSDISCSAAEFDTSSHAHSAFLPSQPSTITPRRDSWFQKAKSFTSGSRHSITDDSAVGQPHPLLQQLPSSKVSPVIPSVARLFPPSPPVDLDSTGDQEQRPAGRYRSKLDQEMYERSLQEAAEVNNQMREQTRRVSLRKSITRNLGSDLEGLSDLPCEQDTDLAVDLTVDLNVDLNDEEGDEDLLGGLEQRRAPQKKEAARRDRRHSEGPASLPHHDREADAREVERLQGALSDALAQLDAACKEHEKQSTIYSITRKEMFAAQEKVDELSFNMANVEEMNIVLKENVNTMSSELLLKDARLDQLTGELATLNEKFAVQVKLNTSLTEQVEKLEQKEYMKDRKLMGTAMEIDQSNAKLLADLKRMKESLFYSEDKVSSLTERIQMRDKEIETNEAKNAELQLAHDKQVESLATLKLEYDLLKQHDKKQKVKRDRLSDMLQHSEQVIDSRRDELEGLRSSLADAEAQLDSLNTETYHLNLGRMQLENANETLRMQLATTLDQLEELQQRGSSGDDYDQGEGSEDKEDGSGEDSVCDEGSHRQPVRTASNSWRSTDDNGSDDSLSGTPKNKTPRGSPSHKLIRQLQHKVEMMAASKHDSDVIIENLNKHIDSVNLASSNKINDLATQNNSLKEKSIQLTATLDTLKIDNEESEKKVLSLVAERYNLQSDIESQKAQIVYLKSRERTMEARSVKSPEGVTTPRGDSQLKTSYESPLVVDGGAGAGPDSEATTTEMVNTLLVQNKELLASNMEWEQRYESIDLLSKAAVKGRKLLTEESIELKSDVQRLGDENLQLEETNRALVEEAATANQRARSLQKELLTWRHKYVGAVASGGSSNVPHDSDTDTTLDLTTTSDVDRSSISSKDNEREYLINALIEAKMNVASAALERDTRRASCNYDAESGFVKRTFINSQYNSKVEEDLVQQLITAKMNAAGFALERDEHGKRIVGLKRLIQFYAERVATLEVAAARGIQAPKTTAAPTGGEKAPTVNTSLLLCGSLFRKSSTSLFNPVWKWEKKYFELRVDRLCIHEEESGEVLEVFKFSPASKLVVEPENSAARHANAWSTFRTFALEGGCVSNSKKRLDIGADSVVEAELWVDAIRQALQRLPT